MMGLEKHRLLSTLVRFRVRNSKHRDANCCGVSASIKFIAQTGWPARADFDGWPDCELSFRCVCLRLPSQHSVNFLKH